VEESIDFALLKNKQTKKKFLKGPCLFQKRRVLLESRIKERSAFYLCGKSLDVYDLRFSRLDRCGSR